MSSILKISGFIMLVSVGGVCVYRIASCLDSVEDNIYKMI
jgi:hypothetical protein